MDRLILINYLIRLKKFFTIFLHIVFNNWHLSIFISVGIENMMIARLNITPIFKHGYTWKYLLFILEITKLG
jgi:hypothetical protein